MRLQAIIEGHGEEGAAALLLRRVLGEILDDHQTMVRRPHRRRGIEALLGRNGNDLIRFQRVAEADSDAVLWLLDHDDGCILKSLESSISILKKHGVVKPTAFAFIAREYESMFLYEAVCCQRVYGVEHGLFYGERGRRDAKGVITRLLPYGTSYKPTVDQERLTARMDLTVLRQRMTCFDHLVRAVDWLRRQNEANIYGAP